MKDDIEYMINAANTTIENKLIEGLPRDVPDGLDEFYSGFEPLPHPLTGKAMEGFADYQRSMWDEFSKHYRLLYLKGPGTDITRFCCLKVIHMAQTVCMGDELLVVGQDRETAEGLIRFIRELYVESIYAKYVIYDHKSCDRGLLDSMVTTDREIYLRNPHNLSQPTKILPCHITDPSSMTLHKRVSFVYASDIGLAEISDERMRAGYNTMFIRLANSNGKMIIETEPGMSGGKLWDLCKDRKVGSSNGHAEIDPEPGMSGLNYWVRVVRSQQAVDAGLMDQEYFDSLKNAGVDSAMRLEACFKPASRDYTRNEI